MEKKKILSAWVLTAGLLILVLGFIHVGATPIVMREFGMIMLPEQAHVFLFMYLATGAATILAGSLTIFASRGLAYRQRWAWLLAWNVAVFMLLLGIGAVYAMLSNPFAHLTLVFAIGLTIPLIWYGPMFKNRPFPEEE